MTDHKSVWMHIGAGSFHRAHQAWYLNKLYASGDKSWSISLGNLRDDANILLDNLAKQNGEYYLETVSPEGERKYDKISVVTKILPWDKKVSSLINEGKQAKTRVIAFTVTEGGYYLNHEQKLDMDNKDIQIDLKGGVNTLYGTLVQILKQRIQLNGEPVTLLSCDNVRHNGDLFRKGFLEFLQHLGSQELYDWVKQNTTSPNTMVDRITPRPAADLGARVKEATGFDDKAPVMSESFAQWVIEDNFANGRPALEKVGCELVESVTPWEEAKIRILNASHSCIAWAGTLAGCEFIDESVSLPPIKKMVWHYVTDDVIPALSPSPVNLEQYRDIILSRFSNRYVKDTNQRVAADGLAKLPGFITPTLLDRFASDALPKSTAVLPALFFAFLVKWHNNELSYEYQDPMIDEVGLKDIMAAKDGFKRFISIEKLYGKLANSEKFHKLMEETLKHVQTWQKDTTKDMQY